MLVTKLVSTKEYFCQVTAGRPSIPHIEHAPHRYIGILIGECCVIRGLISWIANIQRSSSLSVIADRHIVVM